MFEEVQGLVVVGKHWMPRKLPAFSALARQTLMTMQML
jgi:hypothetical protein